MADGSPDFATQLGALYDAAGSLIGFSGSGGIAQTNDPGVVADVSRLFPDLAKKGVPPVPVSDQPAAASPAPAATTASPDYGSLIDAAAQKHGVDPQLARAIALNGEGYGHWTAPSKQSPKGATGVMQIMPENANGADLIDPAQNIDRGVAIIADLAKKYNGDPRLVAAAYNAGPGAVDHHGGVPPYPETQSYVERVAGAVGSGGVSDAAKAAAFGDNTPAASTSQVSAAAKAAAFGDDQQPTGPQGTPAQQAALADAQKALAGPGTPDVGLTTVANSVLGGLGPQIMGGEAALGTGAQNALAHLGIGKAAPYGMGDAYTAARDTMQGQFDQNAQAHPLANALENVAGFATPGSVAEHVGGALTRGLTRVAPKLASNVVGRVAARTLGGAGTMGAIGAAQANAHGESLGETGREAGMSAAIGVPLGLAGEAGVGMARNALRGVAPFAAAASRRAAEGMAGRTLARGATDLAGAQNALDGLQPLVPGSNPTTFQATGDMGLGAMERGARTANPAPFKAAEAEQVAARTHALQGLQQGGDVTALPATLQANEKAARQAEGRLWDAIDPDRTLTANVQATKQRAAEIMGELSPTSAKMGKREQGIFEAAQAMSDVSPARDLIELRKNVNDALGREITAGRRGVTYARLSQMKGAIEDNLNTTIGDAITQGDAAVARGEIAADNSPRAQWERAKEEAARAGQSIAFGGREGGVRSNGAPGAAGSVGAPRAEASTGGGPSAAPRDQALSGAPSFDEAARGRLSAANAATRERAETFGNRPVKQVGGLSEPNAITARVGSILSSGNGVEGMRALSKAIGDDRVGKPALRQAVADHIADRLLSNTEAGTTGVPGLKADQTQSFLRRNRAALGEVFSPDEMSRLDAIARDIQRAKRSENALRLTGQSNTAQDQVARSAFLKHGARGGLDMLGGLLGHYTHIPGGELVGAFATDQLQMLRAAGVNRVNDLVTQALLNPEVFERLTAKMKPGQEASALRDLTAALGRGVRTATGTGAAYAIQPRTLKEHALAGY